MSLGWELQAQTNLPGLMARFPRTRIAIASDTIQWTLEKLGLTPSAIAKPNDAEDLANTLVRAESAEQDPGMEGQEQWRPRNALALQAPAS